MSENKNMMVPAGFGGEVATTEEDEFDKLVKTSSWLPRIDLMGGSSKLAKKGEMKPGAYALITDKEKFADLGSEFNGLVFCFRFKALKFTDGGAVNCYDVNSELFSQIQAEAAIKDSGCSFGPEFLLWIPGHGFATYFANSKTARRECPVLKTIIKDFANDELPAVTFKSKFIDPPKSKYSWWGPDLLPCTIPFAEQVDWAEVKAESDKFKNPPKTTLEKAEPVAEGDRE